MPQDGGFGEPDFKSDPVSMMQVTELRCFSVISGGAQFTLPGQVLAAEGRQDGNASIMFF